jgi:hypothetical protein
MMFSPAYPPSLASQWGIVLGFVFVSGVATETPRGISGHFATFPAFRPIRFNK